MPIDMTGSKAPPRKSGPRAAPKTVARTNAREEAVNGLFQLGQFGCVMFGQHADAAAIGMHGANISREIVNLADMNEKIGAAVDYLLQAGPYAGLVTACLPLALQILANHKRIPSQGVPGIYPPEMLAAQFEAEQQAQALRMAQESQAAQEEIARIQGEMAAAQMANGQGHTTPDGMTVDSDHIPQ